MTPRTPLVTARKSQHKFTENISQSVDIMSTKSLAIAFVALALTVLAATVIVGGVFLADNTEAMQVIRKIGQTPPAVEAEAFDMELAQRLMDERRAVERLEKIANGYRTEWIQSEMEDRVAFCLDSVAKHYPDRSIKKLCTMAGILLDGMNQNRLKDKNMTSHEMARHMLSVQGEQIEIEANRIIEGR